MALRYSCTYGPRQSVFNPNTSGIAILATRLLNDQPPILYEDGEQTRDFCYIEDIARANLLSATTDKLDGLPVNIGSGRATTIREVAGMVSDALGVPIEPVTRGEFRPGERRHLTSDISRARDAGYEPTTDLATGIERYLGGYGHRAACATTSPPPSRYCERSGSYSGPRVHPAATDDRPPRPPHSARKSRGLKRHLPRILQSLLPSAVVHRRVDAYAVCVLFALTVASMWGFLGDEPIVGPDPATQYYPWYAFLGESLRAGDIPAWNPHQFSRAPFAADPLSGWTYLPAMLLFTFLPLATAAKAYTFLTLFLAGLFTYALARGLGMGTPGALLAAVAYEYSGFLYLQNICCLPY